VAVAALAIAMSSCGSQDDAVGPDAEAATVTPIKGSDASKVTLSAEAAERLGIRTARIVAGPAGREVIPYDAVVYDAGGATFTYTSPGRLQFVRRPIDVVRITGGRAILSSGPPVGTAVVIVGSQELYGSEYEVEED
jgi:hypothetical protein